MQTKAEVLAVMIFFAIAQALFGVVTVHHAFDTIRADTGWIALFVGIGTLIVLPLTIYKAHALYITIEESS